MNRAMHVSVTEATMSKARRGFNALNALSGLMGNLADKGKANPLDDGCAVVNAEDMTDLLDCIKAQIRPCIVSAKLV